MARISVDASELNRLAVDLGQAGAQITDKARLVVAKTALDTEAGAKAFAPVDTGNLRNSIGVDMESDRLGAQVGPTASYGAYVEFGTSRNAPAAYMGPAFDRAQPAFVSALAKLIADL